MKYLSSIVVSVTPLLLLSLPQTLWAKSSRETLHGGQAVSSGVHPSAEQRPDFEHEGNAFQIVVEARDRQLEKVSGKVRKTERSQWTKREIRDNHLEKFLSGYLTELRGCARDRPKKPRDSILKGGERPPPEVGWPLHRNDPSSRLELSEIVAGLGANQSTAREAASKFLSNHLDMYADELQSLASSASDREVKFRANALVLQLPARNCVLLAQQKYAEKIFQEVYPKVPFATCGKGEQ